RAHAGAAVAGGLALAVERVHARDLHVEDRLDGVADLRLRRVLVDLERVHVVVEQAVGLLGDHGLEDDVAWVLHDSSSLVLTGPPGSEALVKTTQSDASTS